MLFLIYFNDIDNGLLIFIVKFANDTKVFRSVANDDDRSLHHNLDMMIDWSH